MGCTQGKAAAKPPRTPLRTPECSQPKPAASPSSAQFNPPSPLPCPLPPFLQDTHGDVHNEYRRKHHACDLVYDVNLARNAKVQANLCLKAGKMLHGTCDGEGQNIYTMSYSGYTPDDETVATKAVRAWYDTEVSKYTEAGCGLKGMQNGAGHFTQVVWKATNRFGMAIAREEGRVYVVTNYAEAGNVADDHYIRSNVWMPGDPDAPPVPSKAALPRECNMEQLQQVHADVHNAFRKKHRACDLTYDEALARNAQIQADICLEAGKMMHGTCDEEGQNLYMLTFAGYTPDGETVARDAVTQWYETELPLYQKAGGGIKGMRNDAGHFTQVVWKGTTRFGMAIARSSNMVIVCTNYAEAGNLDDDYFIRKNVWLPGDPDEPPPPSNNIIAQNASDVNRLQHVALDIVNAHRKKHHVKVVKHDASLAAKAQKHAEKCVKAKNLQVYNTKGIGETLYMISFVGGSPDCETIMKEAIESWYADVEVYKKHGGGVSGLTNGAGNFTQLVWKGSTKMGLGFARSEHNICVIAFFTPQGNITDEGIVRANVYLQH